MIDSLSTAAANVAETTPPPTAQSVTPVAPAAAAGAGLPGQADAKSNDATASQPQPSTRLLIERDGGQGYVYRLVDTVTGRLLVELPRAQLDELKSYPAYTAGALLTRSV